MESKKMVAESNSIIEIVRERIPDEITLIDMADFFKVFGAPTSCKILACLEVRDLYVTEIAEITNMSISAISHQLRILRNAKLVKATKSGKEVRYSLDDDHVSEIVKCGLEHVKERQ